MKYGLFVLDDEYHFLRSYQNKNEKLREKYIIDEIS